MRSDVGWIELGLVFQDRLRVGGQRVAQSCDEATAIAFAFFGDDDAGRGTEFVQVIVPALALAPGEEGPGRNRSQQRRYQQPDVKWNFELCGISAAFELRLQAVFQMRPAQFKRRRVSVERRQRLALLVVNRFDGGSEKIIAQTFGRFAANDGGDDRLRARFDPDLAVAHVERVNVFFLRRAETVAREIADRLLDCGQHPGDDVGVLRRH